MKVAKPGIRHIMERMKKAAAIFLMLVMAVPAFAQPLCAMACGGSASARPTCCCSSRLADTGEVPVLTVPSCCRLDTVLGGDFDRGAAAIPTVVSAVADLVEYPVAFTVSVALSLARTTSGQLASFGFSGGPPGLPISLLSPPLRL